VAVFLRKLEHFDGILILTTNLVDHFDSAVLDRMHLQMQYHHLDKAAKKEVVTGFLKSLCGDNGLSNFGADYLDRFVGMKVNGRQVGPLDDTRAPNILTVLDQERCVHCLCSCYGGRGRTVLSPYRPRLGSQPPVFASTR